MWKTRAAVLSAAVLAALFIFSSPLPAGEAQRAPGGQKTGEPPRTELAARAQPVDARLPRTSADGESRVVSFGRRSTLAVYPYDAFWTSPAPGLNPMSDWQIEGSLARPVPSRPVTRVPRSAGRRLDDSVECLPR